MTWGALLLGLFLVVGWRSRGATRAPLLPVMLATAAVLAVVYVNLGQA